MKLTFAILYLFPFIILTSCSNQPNMEELKGEIIKSDKAMSELAAKEGFLKAILFYANDDIVKFYEGELPIIGKSAFEQAASGKSGPKTLTWEPVKAEAAESGELGYSWGNWKFILKDTTIYGNYFTLWKKHKDGSWKVALDGGNSTPAPR